MQARARSLIIFLALLWLSAIVFTDVLLYGSRLERLWLRLFDLALSAIMWWWLGRPRPIWLVEGILVALGLVVTALGASSIPRMHDEHVAFSVAARLYGPMLVGYFLRYRWRAAALFYTGTLACVAAGVYADDPGLALRRYSTLFVVGAIPFILLVFAARRREVEARREYWLRVDLIAATRMLEQEEALRSELIAYLSHDFREPLTQIQVESELLRTRAPESAPSLARIEANARYLAQLTEQLLEEARRGGTGHASEPAPIAIGELARSVAAQLEPAEGGRVAVSAAEVFAEGAQQDVHRILLNLVGNALRHGGPRAQVSVEVRSDAAGLAVIDVSNDGNPIEPKVRANLFFPEERRDEAGRARGLGLPLARALAQRNGGDLAVVDDPTRTTFRLTLRAASAATHTATDAHGISAPAPSSIRASTATVDTRSTSPNSSSSGGRPHLLVVDDNADMRELLARVLEADFELTVAPSLSRAREHLDTLRPDCVVSDMRLSDGMGIDLASTLREASHLHGVPLVIVSGLIDPRERSAALSRGAADFIAKPFSPTELLARIHAVVNRARALIRQREDLLAEVHDGVSASLARAAILLSKPGDEKKHDALASVNDGIAEVKELMRVTDAQPEPPEDVLADVRRELGDACERHGLELAVAFDASVEGFLAPLEAHALRRAARESLTNIIKHACATRVAVNVIVARDRVCYEISDDGCGFPEGKSKGRGLGLLERRLRRMGGSLETGNLEHGAFVRATFPLAGVARRES